MAIDFENLVHSLAEIDNNGAGDSRGSTAISNVAAHGDGVDGDEVLVCPFHDRGDLRCGRRVDDCAADHLLLADDVVSIMSVAESEVSNLLEKGLMIR